MQGGNKCWFFHDEKHVKENLSTKVKQNLTKKFKDEKMCLMNQSKGKILN